MTPQELAQELRDIAHMLRIDLPGGNDYELESIAVQVEMLVPPEETVKLDAVETAIRILAASISHLSTELLVIKAHVATIAENTHTRLDEVP